MECLLALVAGLAFFVAAAPVPAYPDRPAPAHTGGFGEPTCLACHFDGELNPSGGSLEVSGWPAAPRAGRTYDVAVRLRRSDLVRAGFQLAVRTTAGEQAGTLHPVDTRTAVADTAGISYLHHTAAGSLPTSDGASTWRFRWTAPRATPALRVHIVANAANGDASALGDAIYSDSLVIGILSDTSRHSGGGEHH